MTKITVKKNVEQGKVEFIVIFNGVTMDSQNDGMPVCQFTGKTDATACEPLRDKDFHRPRYGFHDGPDDMKISYPIFDKEDSAQDRAEKIATRLISIRAWVEKCKAVDLAQCQEATVLIPPLEPKVVQKRNEKGQFAS